MNNFNLKTFLSCLFLSHVLFFIEKDKGVSAESKNVVFSFIHCLNATVPGGSVWQYYLFIANTPMRNVSHHEYL